MMERPRLTPVTPLYNEEDNLDLFAREVSAVFFGCEDLDSRVNFVDDGRPKKPLEWRQSAGSKSA
jgi:hypothetical protein